MRTFIALDFPLKVNSEIVKIQELIKKQNLFLGKFTESENLHLTLKFLGDIDEEKIELVKERLSKIKFNLFEVHLGNVGIFTKFSPRILWIELRGRGLFELQKNIDEPLKDLFKPEERFMAHLTIARIKKVFDKNKFLDYIHQIKIPKLDFSIDKFYLKKSELFESGPVYEDLLEVSSINSD